MSGMFHNAAELPGQMNNQRVTQASVGHIKSVLLTKPALMEVKCRSVPGLFEMLCREHGHCQKHCAQRLVMKPQRRLKHVPVSKMQSNTVNFNKNFSPT